MDESSAFSSRKTEKNRNPRGAQAFFFSKNLNFFEFFCGMAGAGKDSGFGGGLLAGGFCGFGDFLEAQKAV